MQIASRFQCLTNVRGVRGNVARYASPSSVLQFFSYLLHPCFLSKVCLHPTIFRNVLTFAFWLFPSKLPTVENSVSSFLSLLLHRLPLPDSIDPFFSYCFKALRYWLWQAPAAKLLFLLILGIHNRDWVLCSSENSTMRREAWAFAAISKLYQSVDYPISMSDRDGDHPHNPDLIIGLTAPLIPLLRHL